MASPQTKPEAPVWLEGKPVNLPAAAHDALAWLKLHQAPDRKNRARLEACIKSLSEQLGLPR